jgi:LPXTG-motif cell wall-anchored protein
MMSGSNWMKTGLVLATTVICFAFAGASYAQVQTQRTTTAGNPTKEVNVEHGQVVLVEGNDLVIKMEDGSIRHIPNVSGSVKIDVDGKQVGIHELKPGMHLHHTITTVTTPQVVTTVQNVTGKVWHVSPPTSVILQLQDGTNQSFKIPKGQKFNMNGQMVDAFGLKKGMIVTATKIVEEPETVISEHKKITGTMPAPPPAPPADVPILVVTAEAPAPIAAVKAPTSTVPAKLPKTGNDLPLIGLLGLLCILASLGVKFLRASLGV